MLTADVVTRADVRVSREYGWVTHKRTDAIVGCVWRDHNAAGQPIWRATSGDIGSFAFKHADAVETVLNLHNMQEKARAYDLLSRVVKPGPNQPGSTGETDSRGRMVWRWAEVAR